MKTPSTISFRERKSVSAPRWAVSAFSPVKRAFLQWTFPQKLFIGMVLGMFFLTLLRSLPGYESIFCSMLHSYRTDTFMDFFNSVYDSMFEDPYIDRGVIYPPLTYLFYRYCGQFLSGIEGSSLEMRSLQTGLIAIFALTAILCWLLWRAIRKASIPKLQHILPPLLLFCSLPFLYAFERGNSIVLAVLFLFLYIRWYDADHPALRELALLCLAVAAAIKIYPAVWGLLLIRDKRWKEAARCILYGLLVILVPFVFFEGADSFVALLHNVLTASGSMNSRGIGFRLDLLNVSVLFQSLFGGRLREYFPPLFAVFGLMLAFVFFTAKKRWMVYAALAAGLILFPNFSFTYVLIYMTIPLITFLNQSEDNDWQDCLYALLFAGMFMLVPVGGYKLFEFARAMVFNLNACTLVENLSLITFVIFLFVHCAVQTFHSRRAASARVYTRKQRIAALTGGLTAYVLVVILLIGLACGQWLRHQYYEPVTQLLAKETDVNASEICYLTQGSARQSAKFGHTQTELEKLVQDGPDEIVYNRSSRISSQLSRYQLGRGLSHCSEGLILDRQTWSAFSEIYGGDQALSKVLYKNFYCAKSVSVGDEVYRLYLSYSQ